MATLKYWRAVEDVCAQGRGEGYHERAGKEGYEHGSGEGADTLGAVACAVGLCGHAGGAHAEESHEPVEHVEHDGSDGDGAYINRIADVANDGHIDKTEQGRGDIGGDCRPRQCEDCACE